MLDAGGLYTAMGETMTPFEKAIDLVYSLVFDVRVLGLRKGLGLPIYISHRVSVDEVYKGCVTLPDDAPRGSVRIGFGGTLGVAAQRGFIRCEKRGGGSSSSMAARILRRESRYEWIVAA